MDSLIIKDLVIMGNHGLFKEEKTLGQKFLISVEVKYNMKKSAKENDLEASIDYGKLSKEITDILTTKSYDLIETCAYIVLEHIFNNYKFVKEVTVSVKKPWAPIGLPLEYPEIRINRKRRRYYIGLGTNRGDRKENLKNALANIKANNIEIVKESKIYETEAWGLEDQDDFLNQVIEIETFEEPEDLLKILNKIENEMGRVREIKWGPRIIDLDILFQEDLVLYTDDLKIPHPYVEEREFVLEPLNEIAPFFIHPVLNKQIRYLCK